MSRLPRFITDSGGTRRPYADDASGTLEPRFECCCDCCDYTLTITNCPALNGSYDKTYDTDFDDGTVLITRVTTTITVSLKSDPMNVFITFIADDSFDCPTDVTWSADDWDGCGGGTPELEVECT
ncbi:MAG: hypothetical protein ACPGVG_05620 [Mycobacterium sp.]